MFFGHLPFFFTVLFLSFICYNYTQNTTEFELSDEFMERAEGIDVPIDYQSPENLALLSADKPILRYGWQRTKECEDFGKAYICVRKCLDLNYDVAYANKTCHCTCFKVHDLDVHKFKGKPRKEWMKGYPTTKIPYWIQGYRNPDTPAPTETPEGSGSGEYSGDGPVTHPGGGGGGGGGGKGTGATGGTGGGGGGGGGGTTAGGGGAQTTAKA